MVALCSSRKSYTKELIAIAHCLCRFSQINSFTGLDKIFLSQIEDNAALGLLETAALPFLAPNSKNVPHFLIIMFAKVLLAFAEIILSFWKSFFNFYLLLYNH